MTTKVKNKIKLQENKRQASSQKQITRPKKKDEDQRAKGSENNGLNNI